MLGQLLADGRWNEFRQPRIGVNVPLKSVYNQSVEPDVLVEIDDFAIVVSAISMWWIDHHRFFSHCLAPPR